MIKNWESNLVTVLTLWVVMIVLKMIPELTDLMSA